MINKDIVGRSILSFRMQLRVIFATIGLSALTSLRADEPLSIRVLTYNTHHAEGSDHRLDLDRVAEILRNSRGDLNAVPESSTLSILNNRWNTRLTATPTIPASKPTRQIDYVLASKDSSLELISTEVLEEAIASDHRPLLSIFRQNAVAPNSEGNNAPISRILFGSCIKQDLGMPIFETMTREQPELAIFLGDNIYADTSDMAVMRAKYAMLAENSSFNNFRASCECIATWDDHDYGLNDIGSEYPLKDESQRAFLDFWYEPADSIRWRRPGVYQSYYFGPPGKQIQIILLDTRYFRSALSRGKKRVGGEYIPDQDVGKTMLGIDQWNWLESELKKHAEIRIIATSIQCVASDAGQETWANLPHERNRLFKTIEETHADGVIFISGDRHWAELSAIRESVPYPFYEMTSSSFNQLHARGTPTENSNRADERTFHRENYGMILVHWNQPYPTLSLQVRDMDGKVQIDKSIRLDEIRSRAK